MSYVKLCKRNNCLKVNDMMEVQTGRKQIEFGREHQSEATKKLSEISGEREKM